MISHFFSRAAQILPLVILPVLALMLSACSMTEEVKRIERLKQAEQRQAAQNSSDLTGEQIFIRSCNTCHSGSKRQSFGPPLDNINNDFPDDAALKKFIRAGKGMMPAQTPQILNDQELDNLVGYLRTRS